MNNDYRNTFGKRIKKERNKKKMTQEVFAEHLGKRLGKEKLSIETIRKWEQGRGLPELDTLIQLCDILECDMDYLIGRITEPSHKVKDICKSIGFSEKAAIRLEEKTYNHVSDANKVISALLESEKFNEFLTDIENAYRFSRDLKTINPKSLTYENANSAYIWELLNGMHGGPEEIQAALASLSSTALRDAADMIRDILAEYINKSLTSI